MGKFNYPTSHPSMTCCMLCNLAGPRYTSPSLFIHKQVGFQPRFSAELSEETRFLYQFIQEYFARKIQVLEMFS